MNARGEKTIERALGLGSADCHGQLDDLRYFRDLSSVSMTLEQLVPVRWLCKQMNIGVSGALPAPSVKGKSREFPFVVWIQPCHSPVVVVVVVVYCCLCLFRSSLCSQGSSRICSLPSAGLEVCTTNVFSAFSRSPTLLTYSAASTLATQLARGRGLDQTIINC